MWLNPPEPIVDPVGSSENANTADGPQASDAVPHGGALDQADPAAPGATPPACTSTCNDAFAGTKRCAPNNGAVEECRFVGGCHVWTIATACTNGTTCTNAACVAPPPPPPPPPPPEPSCTSNCTNIGARICTNGKVRECEQVEPGCKRYEVFATCVNGCASNGYQCNP